MWAVCGMGGGDMGCVCECGCCGVGSGVERLGNGDCVCGPGVGADGWGGWCRAAVVDAVVGWLVA